MSDSHGDLVRGFRFEEGVGGRRKVEPILESVAKIYGESRVWSPVFSRLLACGISRRPEQPGSATIIR